MKSMNKKLATTVLAVSLSLGTFSYADATPAFKTISYTDDAPVLKASSAIDVLEDDGSSTIDAQDYEAWTKPVTSYLQPTEKGLMAVRYVKESNSETEGKIVVTYYEWGGNSDNNFHITDRKVIPSELPIWGGFGASEDAYYIVTGQMNEDESDSREVIRITKYDKDWKRIGSAGAKGCNVYEPFAFATVRMDFYKQYLIMKTGRLIYQTNDGRHHQVQLTLEVDTENMTLINSGTDYGYVSHSLNQFIKADDDKIVSVEQGDSYPRGIILFESNNQLKMGAGSSNSGSSGNVKKTTILEVPKNDDYYQNLRATIGGLEISDSSYLVAGNSVIQDEKRAERVTRNIFVISTSKAAGIVQTNWLTSYEEGDGTTRTPQMIKISDDSFMVLWSRDNTVYYTLLGSEGKQVGQTYQHDGQLSDCQPILSNDKICWYTVDGINMNFYTISASNPSEFSVTKTVNGHQYGVKAVTDGMACLSCSVCEHEENMKVSTSYATWWNTIGTYEQYMGGLPDKSMRFNAGDKIYLWITFDQEGINTQMDITISNPEILSYVKTDENMGYFTALSDGITKVTLSPRWNPNLSKKFQLRVGNIAKTKLAYKSMNIKKGKKARLALLDNSKKVSWKILFGKKYISLKNKSRNGVTIKGLKKGKAKVQAVVGKEKYTCTVTVVS